MGRKKGNRQRRTGKRKKTRTHVVKEYDSKTPRSLVVKRGAVAAPVAELVSNLRDVMMPHTMKQLKERKSNKLKVRSKNSKSDKNPLCGSCCCMLHVARNG